MSAVFKVTYKGQEFDIEITRDGELFFLDYDIELDLIRAELGEKPTPALDLADEWAKKHIETIVDFTRATYGSEYLNTSIIIDFAEHALDMCEECRSIGVEGAMRDALVLVRKYINKKLKLKNLKLKRSRRLIYEMSIDLWNQYKDRGILAAPYDIAKSILYAHDSADTAFGSYDAKESSSHAAIGAAESVSQGYDKEYQIAKDLETRWQLRRFVDCIEAIQARKPWPRLEDTE